MMKGKTVFEKIASLISKDILLAAEGNKFPKEKLLQELFGIKRHSEVKLLEKIETAFNGKYIVIPVIVKKDDSKKVEKLIDITSSNLRELITDIVDWIESGGKVTSEDEIEKILKEKLCVFGDCSGDENEEKPKKRNRRGRPPKNQQQQQQQQQQQPQQQLIPKTEEDVDIDDEETELEL